MTAQSGLRKRILRSSSYLVPVNFIVKIFGLLSISIIAKSLIIVEFGALAIIQAFAMTINGLLNFQTGQTVIKYYSESKNNNHL